MSKRMYHLTKTENLKSILTNGLLPRVGTNSNMVDDTEPFVYLTDHASLPYWYILLGQSKMSAIRITGLSPDDFDEDHVREMSMYNEYQYEIAILPGQIKVYRKNYRPTDDIFRKTMKELCLSYLWSISDLCEGCANVYSRPDEFSDAKEDLAADMKAVLSVIQTRLDYSVLSSKEIKAELREMGDGGFSFVDEYMYHGGKRLYEMLPLYPKDEFTPIREQFYRFIKTTFKSSVLKTNTGGWGMAEIDWEKNAA